MATLPKRLPPPRPSVGEEWFIRNKGASALQRAEILEYHGKVWRVREIGGILPGSPWYGEEDVDFEFIQPAHK